MKKIFGNLNLTWKFLIIFAILMGIIVGGLNRIPALENTSFQDIAVYLEMWVIIAIFIISNCKSWKEAVGKCFIFFLISQPLIYLTEVIIDTVFYNVDFKQRLFMYFNNYYFHGMWLPATILTIPGAFIAYQIKKNNVLSALVLSVATTFLAATGTVGMIKIISNGTINHLLNSLICLVMAFGLIFIILDNKKERIIATIITVFGIGIGIIVQMISSNSVPLINTIVDFEEGAKIVECIVEDENIVTVYMEENATSMEINSANKLGETKIKVIDENGTEYVYNAKLTSKDLTVELEK